MTPETLTTLTPETIDALRRLHATNRGSEGFYQEAAQSVSRQPLKELFTEVAAQRSSHADELRQHMVLNGTLVDPSSTQDQFRTAWLKLRALLNQGDPYVLLLEAERAEDRVLHHYAALLESTAGSPINPILTAQHAAVKQAHDRVRQLRDEAKARR